jgi:hypothetical protein
LEWWVDGIVEGWNDVRMEWWVDGRLERWKFGIDGGI